MCIRDSCNSIQYTFLCGTAGSASHLKSRSLQYRETRLDKYQVWVDVPDRDPAVDTVDALGRDPAADTVDAPGRDPAADTVDAPGRDLSLIHIYNPSLSFGILIFRGYRTAQALNIGG